jgi:hypothetical protein
LALPVVDFDDDEVLRCKLARPALQQPDRGRVFGRFERDPEQLEAFRFRRGQRNDEVVDLFPPSK